MDYRIEAMAEGTPDGVAIHSGFPNPAAGKASARPALDFNRLLVQNPSSTFCFRIEGHAWADRGIYDGDIAVIDRAPNPRRTDTVAAWQDGRFVLLPLHRLAPEAELWGILTATIHQYKT